MAWIGNYVFLLTDSLIYLQLGLNVVSLSVVKFVCVLLFFMPCLSWTWRTLSFI